MKNRVLDGVYWSAVDVYSNPIDMQGDTALAIAVTSVSGGGTTNPFVTVEGSFDMQTWSTVGIVQAWTSSTRIPNGPGFMVAVAYGITYKYCRLKLGSASGATGVVNVSCGTFDPN
jgi:hypothetical protein